MRKSQLALLALALLSAAAFGAKELRKPASGDKLDFSLSAPQVQGLDNDEALAFYQKLIADQASYHPVEKKNIEEFALLGRNLRRRGFAALEKPFGGPVFSRARSFTLFRQEDQNLPAMNGEEAYVSVKLEFYYTQNFIKQGAKPSGTEPVPSTVLHGSIFLRCPPGSKEQCPVSGITFHESSIKWGVFPSGRGANSSAGGAGQK